LSAEKDGDDGFLLWQSLHGQTKLASQLGSIMKDVRNVHSSSQKKIEKLRQSLLEVFNEPTNFDEVKLLSSINNKTSIITYSLA